MPRRVPGPLIRSLIGGALSGALVAASAPWVGAWPLLFAALVPWLLSLRDASLASRLLGAAAYVGVSHGILYAWVYDAAQASIGLSEAGAGVAVVVAAVIQGGAPIAFALVSAPLRRRSGAWWPLAWTSAFVALDWAIPQFVEHHFGAGLVASLPFAQICEIGGVHAMSALTVCTSVAVVSGVEARGWTRALTVALACLGLTYAYGSARVAAIESTPPEAELRVAMMHTSIEPVDRNSEVRDRIAWQQDVITEVMYASAPVIEDVDLIVWPEGVIVVPMLADPAGNPSLNPVAQSYSARVWQYAQATDAHLLVGAIRQAASGKRNSVVHYGRSGALAGLYDKRQLFPWGEAPPTLAGVSLLPWLTPEARRLERGDRPTLFDLEGVRVAPNICLEGTDSAAVRDAANQGEGADVLINSSSDRAMAHRGQPESHFYLQRARAIENRLPYLRIADGGITAYVDETGRVIERESGSETTPVRATVALRSVFSLYRYVGDAFVYLLALAGLASLVGARRG